MHGFGMGTPVLSVEHLQHGLLTVLEIACCEGPGMVRKKRLIARGYRDAARSCPLSVLIGLAEGAGASESLRSAPQCCSPTAPFATLAARSSFASLPAQGGEGGLGATPQPMCRSTDDRRPSRIA